MPTTTITGFTQDAFDAFIAMRDEPDLIDLPRLMFNFDRRSLGRLRQLIDCINRGRVAP